MKTTLNAIRSYSPCQSGWQTLLKHLNKTCGDEEPLPFSEILKSNGLEDTIWCMRAAPQYAKEWRLFAVFCARQVSHLLTDSWSLKAIEVAERFANGEATEGELEEARKGAWVYTEITEAFADVAYTKAYWGAARSSRVALTYIAAARLAQLDYLTELFQGEQQ